MRRLARLLGPGVAISIAGWATSQRCGSLRNEPKLPHQPPSWVFGVVWPLLYVTTGVAWYLASAQPNPTADLLLGSVVSLCCAWLVFYLCAKARCVGLVLLVVTAALSWASVGSNALGGNAKWWMVPLALWTTFAATLNASAVVSDVASAHSGHSTAST